MLSQGWDPHPTKVTRFYLVSVCGLVFLKGSEAHSLFTVPML